MPQWIERNNKITPWKSFMESRWSHVFLYWEGPFLPQFFLTPFLGIWRLVERDRNKNASSLYLEGYRMGVVGS